MLVDGDLWKLLGFGDELMRAAFNVIVIENF